MPTLPHQNQMIYRHRMILTFHLNCRETKLGEAVRVTGSCVELGNWDPCRGMLLQTTPSDFPIWIGNAQIDPAKLTRQNMIEYKYVIVNAPPTDKGNHLLG